MNLQQRNPEQPYLEKFLIRQFIDKWILVAVKLLDEPINFKRYPLPVHLCNRVTLRLTMQDIKRSVFHICYKRIYVALGSVIAGWDSRMSDFLSVIFIKDDGQDDDRLKATLSVSPHSQLQWNDYDVTNTFNLGVLESRI